MGKQQLFNVLVDALNAEEAISYCSDSLEKNEQRRIFFVNAHCYNVACSNEHYRGIINRADLLLNDGIGIKIASLLASVRLKANMNGTDLIPRLLESVAADRYPVYLLGGRPGIADKAAECLSRRFPSLKIAGAHHGFLREEETSDLLDEINRSGARILIAGMGVPLQEIWIEEHRKHLPEVHLLIAGGAILDFMAGHVRRAPCWMRRVGAEWVFRLLQEPRRLAGRYLQGNVRFLASVLFSRLRDSLQPAATGSLPDRGTVH